MNSADRDDPDTTQTIFLSGPKSLARILAQDQPEAALWEPQEMRAVWQHQMRAPIEADLAPIGSSPQEAADFSDKSFSEVLHHANAPVALLKSIKNFAKQMIKDAEDSQLKEIAAALYYTSYAGGITRHGQRLGGMSDPELRGGFEWALGRVWLDEKTKNLIEEAMKAMESRGE